MKKQKIIATLLKIGIKPNCLGFKYIQDAIDLLNEDEEYLYKTTALYYAVGKRNRTGYANAERNIRSAFQAVSWKKEFLDFFQTEDFKSGNLLAILYWKLKECEVGA